METRKDYFEELNDFYSGLTLKQSKMIEFTDVRMEYEKGVGFHYRARVMYTRTDGMKISFFVCKNDESWIGINYNRWGIDKTGPKIKIDFYSWTEAFEYFDSLPAELLEKKDSKDDLSRQGKILLNFWDRSLEDYGILSYYFVDRHERRWNVDLSLDEKIRQWKVYLRSCGLGWDWDDLHGIRLGNINEKIGRTINDIMDIGLRIALKATDMEVNLSYPDYDWHGL